MKELKRDSKTGLKFIVLGTGRNGSIYFARLLQQLGIHCTHERVWHPNGHGSTVRLLSYEDVMRDHLDGDCGWRLVPNTIDFEGVVLHQVRHPLSVINSWVGTPYGNKARYLSEDAKRGVVGAMRLYLLYNKMCEHGNPYLRFQIEKLDLNSLCSICSLLGYKWKINTIKEIFEAVNKKVGTNANRHDRANYTWDELPDCSEKDELELMGWRYGYEI